MNSKFITSCHTFKGSILTVDYPINHNPIIGVKLWTNLKATNFIRTK